jgi:Flp pilus assembly protein TadD
MNCSTTLLSAPAGCTKLPVADSLAGIPVRRRWALTLLLLWLLFTASSGCRATSAWVMNSSGRAHYQKGNYTAARYDFERALMDRPFNATFASNVAKAMHKQGQVQEAEQMFQHALGLNPNHAPSYQGLSELLVSQGRQFEAQQMLQAWQAAIPDSPEAPLAMAKLQKQTGDLMGAEQTLQGALQRFPRRAMLMNELAGIYQQTGRTAQADELYRRSLAVRPLQQEAPANLTAIRRGWPASTALAMAQNMPRQDPAYPGGNMMLTGGMGNSYGAGTVMSAGGFSGSPVGQEFNPQFYSGGTTYGEPQQSAYGPALPGSAFTSPFPTGDMLPGQPLNSGVPMMAPGGMSYPAQQVPQLPTVPSNGAPPLPGIQQPVPSPYAPSPSAGLPGAPVQLGTPVPLSSLQPTYSMSSQPAVAASGAEPIPLQAVPSQPVEFPMATPPAEIGSLEPTPAF